MPITRRTLLGATASLPLLGLQPSRSFAEMALGKATLATVSDGYLTLPGSFIFDPMDKAELQPILDAFSVSAQQLTPECNLALYRDGENTVLFDVGSGPDFMPTAGTVTASLSALDVAPEDISHVIFTHAHPDHIWGLLDEFDEPLFAEATYMMGRAEWDYWWNPDTVHSIGEARAAFAVGAKRRMEAIEDSVVLFDDGQELLPGIAAVSSPGHTPGHMSFEVRSGSNSVLILGDAIGNHHVAFRKPQWPSGSDQNQQLAAQTRRMLFDRITDEKLAIVGFHLPEGGMGRVDSSEQGFVFVPAEA